MVVYVTVCCRLFLDCNCVIWWHCVCVVCSGSYVGFGVLFCVGLCVVVVIGHFVCLSIVLFVFWVGFCICCAYRFLFPVCVDIVCLVVCVLVLILLVIIY